jgi:hypothetical protein
MIKEEKHRILPALDRAHEEALRQGIITTLDAAGMAMAYTLAGVLDGGTLKPIEEVKYMGQLQQILDKYGLSLFGRKERPEVEGGEDPLEALRQLRTETTNHTNTSPN